MVGATGGRLGAIKYQGRYHAIHNGPIYGPRAGGVTAKVSCFGGFLPPLDDLMLVFAFFRLEGRHNHCLHSPVE